MSRQAFSSDENQIFPSEGEREGNIMKPFIRIGDQIFAVNHITHAARFGDVVEVRIVSCPEPVRLLGRDADLFWAWHASALYTTTLEAVATRS